MTISNSNQTTKELNYSEISRKIQKCISKLQDTVCEIYGLIDDFGTKFSILQSELEDLSALHKTGKPHISQYVRELDMEELLKFSLANTMKEFTGKAMTAVSNGETLDGMAETVPNTVEKRKAPTKKTKSVRKPNNRK